DRTLPERNVLAALPDLLLIFLILAYIIRVLYKKEKFVKTSLDKYILAFIAINVMQIFNPNKSLLVGIYGARRVLFPVGMYFVAREFFHSKNDVKKFLYIIIVCSIIDIFYGLYQCLMGFTSFDKIYLNDFPDIQMVMIWEGKWEYEGFHKLFSVSGGSYNLFYPLVFFAVILFNLKSIYMGQRYRILKYVFLFLLIILLSFGIERAPIAMIVIGIVVSCFEFETAKRFLKRSLISAFNGLDNSANL
ncbi:unnamed protein product, partial [marine sediment metagenome]